MITKALLYIKLMSCELPSDSSSIEQRALNYFIEKADSIKIFDGRLYNAFDKQASKIYYSGLTGPNTSLNFSMYHRGKHPFIVVDSAAKAVSTYKPWAYPTDNGPKTIQASENFFILGKRAEFLKNKQSSDIRITVSNSYAISGYYYIKISIDKGDVSLMNDVLIKFNAEGRAIAWTQRYGIY